MSHALLTVGRRRRYVSLLLAVGLVATLVPVLPVVADPPDVTYSYDFSGVDNDPWESGWSFVGDETPTIESNTGVMSANSQEDVAVGLRSETLGDTTAELTVVWDSQLRRRWGLALRHDGAELGEESGYYCILRNDDGNQQNPFASLAIYRVSNGVEIELAKTASLSISTDQRLKCEAAGTTIRAKVWDEGTTEPGTWDLEETDSAYGTGRTGIYFMANSGRDVAVDDFELEAFSSTLPSYPDPGGGETFSETFTGAFRADWPNDWTHKSSPGPKLEGNAGSLRGSGGLLTSLLAGTYADSSQLVRVIWNPDNDRTWGIAARHGGQNDGSQSAYYCVLDNGTSPKLEIVRYDSGTPTTLASDSVVAPTTNQWLRCEIEGSDIRAKVWDQGTVEPSAWNIETTDATYATGQVGTLLGATANQSVVLDDYRLGDVLPYVNINYSTSDDRSNPTFLESATVAGDIYVFATDDPDVAEVSFWIDDVTMTGAADRVDDTAPYDLVGDTGSAALPYDTTTLADGQHTVTILVELTDTTTFDKTATFTVDNIPEINIEYSLVADRSNPVGLEAATVIGDIYVFATDDPDVAEVSFWIDDVTMTGAADRVDTAAPYDLVGDNGSAALPYDTTTLADGQHTVTILVEQTDTTTFDKTAFFTVDNASSIGDVSGLVFEDVAGNGVYDLGTDVVWPNTTVEVWDVSQTTLFGSDTTDSAGAYLIEGVSAGTVVVVVDESAAPADTVWSTPTALPVTIAAELETAGVNFGWAYFLAPDERDVDVEISVGLIETLSGDGTDATVDGSATASSFSDSGGITFAESLIYVATHGSVRIVNEFTGAVSTLAGHATETGCVNDADPTLARFGNMSGAATDGVYVYVGDVDCDTIRRILIDTGATDDLTSMTDVVDLVFATDGSLYAVTATKLYRVALDTGATTELAAASSSFTALTADSDDLWFADGTDLKALPLTGGAVSTVASVGAVSALESTGEFLYLATDATGTELERFNKTDFTVASVSGSSTAGYQDGSGIDALLDDMKGLVTGGQGTLFIADSNNFRIRTLGQDPFFSPGAEAFGWDGYGAWNGGLNAGLGNYVTDNTDLDVATSGPTLGLTRTYNSLDHYEGPFGLGWSFNYEMTWRKDSVGNVAVLYPDGRREVFILEPDDTYSPPDGYFSELVADGDGFVLTTRDGTAFEMDSAGLLSAITDLNNNSINLSYTNEQLTSATDDASGRSISFTWTDDRITSASTDSVSAHGGSLTWNYEYDLDGFLVAACDPRDNNTQTGTCWRYEYGSFPEGRAGYFVANDSIPQPTSIGLTSTPGALYALAPAFAISFYGTTVPLMTKHWNPEGNLVAEIEYGVTQEANLNRYHLQNRQIASAGSIPLRTGNLNVGATLSRLLFNTATGLIPNEEDLVLAITDGEGNRTSYSRLVPFEVRTFDALGNLTTQRFDEKYRLIEEEDALGNVTSFDYDANGHRDEITDPNNHTVNMTFDARGNRTSETNAEGETTYMTYDAADNMVTRRDGRSSGPTDNTYLTTFTYDSAKNPTSETGPLGHTKTWTYTDGTEVADFGTGTLPAGLLRTSVTAEGNEAGSTAADYTTTYLYDSTGDLRQIQHPSGLVESFTYDEIGRQISTTVSDATSGTVASTTTTYDEAGNVLTVTETVIDNEVDSDSHQLQTVNVYDDNSNVVSTTLEDLTGDDSDRVTTYSYDLNDRQVSVTDPEGGVVSRTYDAVGNVVTVTDQEGRVTETVYDARNLATDVILRDYANPESGAQPRDITLSQMTYDPAGRLATSTDAEGRVTSYNYDNADRILAITLDDFVNPDATTRDVLLQSFTYDDAGNILTETVGDGTANQRTTNHVYDAAGRETSSTVDPAGLSRTTSTTYDANANPLTFTMTEDGRTEITAFVYDGSDRVISQTVENGAVDLTTTFGYDDRGNVVSVTDPRGNLAGATPTDFTTTHTYDEAGRLVETVAPPVNVEPGPGTAQPTTTYGYNTFGDQTQVSDARGFVTESVYDGLGRVTQITHPDYTPPGEVTALTPTELMTYDQVGNLTQRTSRRGEITTFEFDDLNRVVRQTDPLLTGESAAGVTTFEYDDVGNRTAVVDPRGARTESTYDMMNRTRTSTVLVRQDVGAPIAIVSTFDYDDLGNQTISENPEGDTTTTVFNAASEAVSVTDPTGETTTYEWVLGHQIKTTDPLGRYTETDYDLAGRATEVRRYDPSDLLLTTTGYAYDAAGNQTTRTSPRGFETGADPADYTTTSSYDALNRLTSVVSPVDDTEMITTSYGYDVSGNLTLFTDGNNNSTSYTYNPWNLRETTVEPATTAHPLAVDRTWTTTYDAGGLATEDELPGGVSITRTFDELARLISESGTGDGTSSRALGYDLVGNNTTVSHPTSTISFEYDDRNLVTDQTGGAGVVTFAYDEAGRLTQRVDAAGTHSYTWTARSELDTLTEPLTGTTLDYTWDDASQLTSIDYGATGGTRAFIYDDLGRLLTDTLTDTAPAQTAGYVYGYDVDGNLVSKTITLPGNSDAGLHSYTYDNAGRLVSWTHDTTTVDYEWDAAGNRLTAGADSWTYDQRNRLVTGPEGDYTHTPRGSLLQIDDGSNPVVYDFDPFGRLATVDAISYAYDGLDRVSSRGADSFTYQGFSLDPTSDSTHTYSRSPGGRVVGISDGTTDLLVGADRHGDLTHLHDPNGVVSDTVVYDPYGDPLTTTGTFNPQVGYQGDWTDPTTGHVWMGARWYEATTANFLSRDTVFGELTTPISLNRYTYAWANPHSFWDPDGHASTFIADGQWYGGTTTSSSTSSSSSSSSNSSSNTVDVETAFMTQTIKKTTTASEKAEETVFVQQARTDVATGQPFHIGTCYYGGCYSFGVHFDPTQPSKAAFDATYADQGIPWWITALEFTDAGDIGALVDGAQGRGSGIDSGAAALGILTPIVGGKLFKTAGEWLGKLFKGPGDELLHDNTVEIFRAVGPEELEDIVGSGTYRSAEGLNGKFFFPTIDQADEFAALANKTDAMSGEYCITSGCLPPALLGLVDEIHPVGEGLAYYIPNELLPYIDNIVVHGPAG